MASDANLNEMVNSRQRVVFFVRSIPRVSSPSIDSPRAPLWLDISFITHPETDRTVKLIIQYLLSPSEWDVEWMDCFDIERLPGAPTDGDILKYLSPIGFGWMIHRTNVNRFVNSILSFGAAEWTNSAPMKSTLSHDEMGWETVRVRL